MKKVFNYLKNQFLIIRKILISHIKKTKSKFHPLGTNYIWLTLNTYI